MCCECVGLGLRHEWVARPAVWRGVERLLGEIISWLDPGQDGECVLVTVVHRGEGEQAGQDEMG